MSWNEALLFPVAVVAGWFGCAVGRAKTDRLAIPTGAIPPRVIRSGAGAPARTRSQRFKT